MKESKVIKDVNKSQFRNAQKKTEEWKSIEKMMEFFHSEMSRTWSDEEKVIDWSDGNGKTHLPSYSTMPGFTCMVNGKYPPCFTSGNGYCLYDIRNIRVMEKAVHNTVLILRFPDEFEKSFDLKCKTSFAIKLHVEGDWTGTRELKIVDRVRKNNPQTTIVTYTKKYALVNRYMDEYGKIEGNFHLMYSKWKGLEIINPYHMPECHVYENVHDFLNANEEHQCGNIIVHNENNYEFIHGNCNECFMSHLLNNGKGGCFDIEPEECVKMLAH